jgi:hypothetical protein
MTRALLDAPPSGPMSVTVNVYDYSGPPNKALVSYAIVAERTKRVRYFQTPTCELI